MKLLAEVDMGPATLARAFVEMDDDAQAQFFVECAKAMESWPAHARHMQMHAVGRHLAECHCSTPGARDVVRLIFEGIDEACFPCEKTGPAA